MKNRILSFILPIVFLSGFAVQSHAALMIEPYIGYDMGKVSATTAAAVDAAAKPNLTTLGLRLAYHLPVLLWFGLDGSMGNGKLNPESSSQTNVEISRTNYSVVAGVDLPILLRGWVGYGFYDKITDKDNSKDFTGTSTKFGLGFTALPFISINLEYITGSPTKYDGNDIKTTYSNYDTQSYLLSVSLPLSF